MLVLPDLADRLMVMPAHTGKCSSRRISSPLTATPQSLCHGPDWHSVAPSLHEALRNVLKISWLDHCLDGPTEVPMSLRKRPARPFAAKSQPSYPRILGIGMIALATACGGNVEEPQGSAGANVGGAAGSAGTAGYAGTGGSIPVENCRNGVDDDDDGAIDCADSDCYTDPQCELTGAAPIPFEDCSNGVDDDYDGQIDCADSDCHAVPECQLGGEPPEPFEDCSNGMDDDYDGAVDCADSDCSEAPECQLGGAMPEPFEDCGNGVDDDYDGATDCADSDCYDAPECQMDGAMPAPFEDCSNGVDDDYDNAVDCDDPDCADVCEG